MKTTEKIIKFIGLTEDESREFSKLGEIPFDKLNQRQVKRNFELEKITLKALEKELDKNENSFH